MTEKQIHLFILGATGFVGSELVSQALAQRMSVTALARSAEKAAALASIGARIVIGDAQSPADWVQETAGCDVIIDLLQPELPKRVGLRTIQRVGAMRSSMTSGLLDALQSIPAEHRPLLLSVSGLDDLTPDGQGRVDDASALSNRLSGFAHIGVPVRQIIEKSGIAAVYAYLGTVYGPGKAFAKKLFPQLAEGRFRLPGKGANRMAVVHVQDAARALLYIAGMERTQVSGRSLVIADGRPATMAEFMGFAADCLGGPQPKSAPLLLARLLAGDAVFETATRDIAAYPVALTQAGFKFTYPTYRDGLPPSIAQLGYPRVKTSTSVLDRSAVFVTLCFLAIAAFIGENWLRFPLSVPYMKSLAGGAAILDMRPGYTTGATYQLFDALGQTGRGAYLMLLWTIDLLMPALFGAFLSSVIRRGSFRGAHSLPFFAVACDYGENIAITALLLSYPMHHPVAVLIAASLTVVKLALYAGSVLFAVAGLLLRFFRFEFHKLRSCLSGKEYRRRAA
jgi:NAD dependent epimerase/dehydratase family enzyme